MFTGIIESLGIIHDIVRKNNNITFSIKSSLCPELKVDQSVAHNGVCLTITAIIGDIYEVTAIDETLQKTNLKFWQISDIVNLERAMLINARLDGHFVQGHVDTTATCLEILNAEGSWIYTFEFANQFAHLIIEKGSICVNGISLTCFEIGENTFKVAVIPYTYHHTNISQISIQSIVNLEFDILGKYFSRMASLLKN